MDQLVVKCRCRGTNGECHLCFGTGDVLAHGDEMFYAAPVAPRADKGKPPSKQPHRSAESNGIEAAFLRHAGLGQRASAQALIDAMRLCEKRGQPQVKEVLRQSLRCARDHDCRGIAETSIPGFGKFKVKDTPEREARNPATGATIKVAAAKKLTFAPAKALKDALNQ